MIDQSEIDRVKSHHNLKDVIGSDVAWVSIARSYGGTLKGPCPFCGGKDRFHCHPQTGNWWCRQCGRKGDVLSYWMARYGVSFSEAYRALALAVGIEESKVTDPEPAPEVNNDSDLWLICQSASYPITFEWPGGERTTCITPEEAYSDLWARSMVRECIVLGGKLSDDNYS